MRAQLLAGLLAGFVVVLGACGSGGASPVARVTRPLVRPTRSLIRWRLGRIDPRFDLDSDQVKNAAERAIHIWEAEAGRRLFVYDKGGGFPVSLVFDARQRALNERREADSRIDASKESLELAARDSQGALDRFRRARNRVESDRDSYGSRLQAYDRRVDYWNRMGGAPREVAESLDSERERLASEREDLERDQRAAEAIRMEANNLVDAYNRSVDRYNTAAREFNRKFSRSIRAKIGECLMSGRRAKSISIYAFQDLNHLAVVLAHELGHALGMRHVKGDGALMSAVENGEVLAIDLRVTARDRSELRRALLR